VRYTLLDPLYLARLDDLVLIHTAQQYHNALSQLGSEGVAVETQIRLHLAAVMAELERRGLNAQGWHVTTLEKQG
jgi:hypothetical protein